MIREMALRILIHETFHVLTRNNRDFREAMYGCIGFNILDEPIVFPEDFACRLVTNPDVDRHDSYAFFTVDGAKVPCALVFYFTDGDSNDNGSVHGCDIGLVPLDEGFSPLVSEEGFTVVYPVPAAGDFFDVVGENTYYIVNPEEIMADNFSLTVMGKAGESRRVLDKVDAALKRQ